MTILGTQRGPTPEAVVDGVPGGPLLVIGSVPPHNRDLDLLVLDADLPALQQALAGAGFERRDPEWVRFAGGRAQAVDLAPADDWEPGPAVVAQLLDRARPLDGFARLCAPCPADALLLLARRSLGVHAPLAPKHAERIAQVLAADPGAWRSASAQAPAWGAPRRLAALQDAFARGGRASARLAAAAAVEGNGGLRAAGASLARSALPGAAGRRGAVIALSGIDGSGKSTQAQALAQALEDLGHEATVGWSRITYDSALRTLAAPVKRILALRERSRGEAPPAPPPSGDRWVLTVDADGTETWSILPSPGDSTARALRDRFRLLDAAWTTMVAIVHGLTQRRALAGDLRAGRIVVRDRYVLDAAVQLEQSYGRGRRPGRQIALLRLLCPRPAAAFWLDVDPAQAYARKPEEYSLADLAEHRASYAAEHRALGVLRIDGSQDPETVSAAIAREAWRTLG